MNLIVLWQDLADVEMEQEGNLEQLELSCEGSEGEALTEPVKKIARKNAFVRPPEPLRPGGQKHLPQKAEKQNEHTPLQNAAEEVPSAVSQKCLPEGFTASEEKQAAVKQDTEGSQPEPQQTLAKPSVTSQESLAPPSVEDQVSLLSAASQDCAAVSALQPEEMPPPLAAAEELPSAVSQTCSPEGLTASQEKQAAVKQDKEGSQPEPQETFAKPLVTSQEFLAPPSVENQASLLSAASQDCAAVSALKKEEMLPPLPAAEELPSAVSQTCSPEGLTASQEKQAAVKQDTEGSQPEPQETLAKPLVTSQEFVAPLSVENQASLLSAASQDVAAVSALQPEAMRPPLPVEPIEGIASAVPEAMAECAASEAVQPVSDKGEEQPSQPQQAARKELGFADTSQQTPEIPSAFPAAENATPDARHSAPDPDQGHSEAQAQLALSGASQQLPGLSSAPKPDAKITDQKDSAVRARPRPRTEPSPRTTCFYRLKPADYRNPKCTPSGEAGHTTHQGKGCGGPESFRSACALHAKHLRTCCCGRVTQPAPTASRPAAAAAAFANQPQQAQCL